MSMPANARLNLFRLGLAGAVVGFGAGLLAWRQLAVSGRPAATLRPAVQARRNSADCRSGHEDIYRTWAESDDAQAHRPVAATRVAAALGGSRSFEQNGIHFRLA